VLTCVTVVVVTESFLLPAWLLGLLPPLVASLLLFGDEEKDLRAELDGGMVEGAGGLCPGGGGL